MGGINDVRMDNRLPVLENVHGLSEAALRQANDMAINDFVDHTGSDGSTVGERLEDSCYRWSTYGEILAAGYENPEDAIAAWLDSDGHMSIILSEVYTEFGAGYAYFAA